MKKKLFKHSTIKNLLKACLRTFRKIKKKKGKNTKVSAQNRIFLNLEEKKILFSKNLKENLFLFSFSHFLMIAMFEMTKCNKRKKIKSNIKFVRENRSV